MRLGQATKEAEARMAWPQRDDTGGNMVQQTSHESPNRDQPAVNLAKHEVQMAGTTSFT